MNSPSIHFAFTAEFRRGAVAAALASLTLLASGCGTYSTQRSAELFANRAPVPTRVAPGEAFRSAERVAAARDGDFALEGAGESMAPYYNAGTALVIHPTSYFMLRPGMPVVYVNQAGAEVAHVLVEKSTAGWVVMGLNNAEPDDELVTPKNLVGVITNAFVADTSRRRERHADAFGTGPEVLIAQNLLH